MRSPKPQKINAVADFSASVYRSGDVAEIALRNGVQPEETVLNLAVDSVLEAQNDGVLAPELRSKIEAMTQDYAKILARIDRLAARKNEKNLPIEGDNPPLIIKPSDEI